MTGVADQVVTARGWCLAGIYSHPCKCACCGGPFEEASRVRAQAGGNKSHEMRERRHARWLLGGTHMHDDTSRRGFRRGGVLIGALALLLGPSCFKKNGDDCGSLMRGCVDIFNNIDRSVSVSATPPGTVVNLPAAIYYSAIDEGLGSVA